MYLSVLVRQSRPWISKVFLLTWFFYRLFKLDSQSLLRLLTEALDHGRNHLEQILSEYNANLPFLPILLTRGWNVMEDFLALVLLSGTFRLVYVLLHYSYSEWKHWLVSGTFEWAEANLSLASTMLAKHTSSFENVLPKDPKRTLTVAIPDTGRDPRKIIAELQRYAEKEDLKWREGRVSGAVYPNEAAHTDLMGKVYSIYAWSNPLHPGCWPKLNQCEGEVIAMTANLLHGPPIGSVTSGGTESILLAIRAHLNHYGKRREIRFPEIICGSTAHASVNKACEIFGIRKVTINCREENEFRLDPNLVRRKVTSNTIMIYSSAPCYPHGVVDPIEELSDIAFRYDVGLHVDACLGGFVLPFCDDAPSFDFRNEGVTSISADTHKYGYATKGTSVVIYRSKELRHGQYFSYANWTGGLYSTPTFAGSRSGGLIACAWSALVATGRNEYERCSRLIVKAAREIAYEIPKISGLKLLTKNPFMVVSIGSDELDIYSIQDIMTSSGWSLNSLQSPASVHICITMSIVPNIRKFIDDLKVSVEKVRCEGSKDKKRGTAGVYGTVCSLPPGPVEYALRYFTDATLSP